jgi:3-oxoacyl-[acyl-carrier protein] reductase
LRLLEGKTAIITGASRGIGKGIATVFAQNGANVAFTFSKSVELAKKFEKELISLGVKAVAYQSDAANYSDSIKLIEKINTDFVNIDILVNNAGIAGPSFKTWEYPLKDWQEIIDIDLNGVFYCCKSIVPSMIENNYGRIVNIASIAGKEGNPNAMPYSAAKAGVIALTKSLGKELAAL